jgi:hypothetical protein
MLSAHTILWEKDIFCGLCKKDKKNISWEGTYEHQRLYFLHKNAEILCADIEYLDVHLKFIFRFFRLKIIF